MKITPDVIETAALVLSVIQEATGPVPRRLLCEEIKRAHPNWVQRTCMRRFQDARWYLVHLRRVHMVSDGDTGFLITDDPAVLECAAITEDQKAKSHRRNASVLRSFIRAVPGEGLLPFEEAS